MLHCCYSPDHWEADVHPDQCFDLTGKREKCTLYLSFCDNMKDVAGCANSTVCIGVGNEYYRFGQYSEYMNPFALSCNACTHILCRSYCVSLQWERQ